jgi:hypothetical protein
LIYEISADRPERAGPTGGDGRFGPYRVPTFLDALIFLAADKDVENLMKMLKILV